MTEGAWRGSKYRRLKRGWVLYGLPVVVFLSITLPFIWQGAFRVDTGWYSAIAVQAWRDGSLWTLMGEPGQAYFNKPPLAFWIHGLVLHVFGVGLVQARLPTVLADGVCIVLTARIGRVLAGARAGVASALVLATTYEFFRRTHEVSLDMWQSAFMLGAVWLTAEGAQRSRRWLLVVAGIPIGLALMTKPLVALAAFPILSVWLAWTGRLRLLPWLGASAGVALLIAAPWHVSMIVLHGEAFTGQYLGEQIADRSAGNLDEQTGGRVPPWFYADRLVRGYWPWLIVLALALIQWMRHGLGKSTPLSITGRLERLGLVWFVAWFVIITVFPDRRDRYALPIYPGLAMIVGLWLASRSDPRQDAFLRRWVAPMSAAGAVLISLLPIRMHGKANPQWPALFEWLRAQGEPVVWQGGLSANKGARLYLEFGYWPITTQDQYGSIVAQPPVGALILHHLDEKTAISGEEDVLFESGKLVVSKYMNSEAMDPSASDGL